MKKIFKNILFVFTATLFLTACGGDDLTVLNENAETTVSLSTSDLVLDILNTGQDALTISWIDPDYGFNAGANYIITFTAGSTSSKFPVGNVLTTSFETSQLNKILLELGLVPEEAAEVSISVDGQLSVYTDKGAKSNITKLMATPYSTVFTPIYMIGDAVLGWDTAKAVEVYGTGPGKFDVIAKFNNGGAFRFFDAPDWGATSYNYPYFGSGADASFFENANDGDSNLKFIGATGYYSISVNLIAKTVEMKSVPEPVHFMVGAGVPDAGWGWDTPVKMTWVQDGIYTATTGFINDTFRLFTASGDWGSGRNYPYYTTEGFDIDAKFENANDGDSNFKFIGTPGTYTITVNYLDKTITLE